MIRKTYHGWLRLGDAGEDAGLLFLADDGPDAHRPLAARIADDLESYGRRVAAHWCTTPDELPWDAECPELTVTAIAAADARVTVQRDEQGVFVGAQEVIRLRRYDLLAELKARAGKGERWLRLELDIYEGHEGEGS